MVVESSPGQSSSPAAPQRKAAAAAAAAASGVSRFLSALPSSGNFSSGVVSSNVGRMRVYVCDHDTSPPEGQIIKTDTTNILIRALQINKQNSELKDGNKGKRPALRSLDAKNLPKRPHMDSAAGSSEQEGSNTGFSEETLQAMTVERLRVLLKERGLSPKGKKDELITRLMDYGA